MYLIGSTTTTTAERVVIMLSVVSLGRSPHLVSPTHYLGRGHRPVVGAGALEVVTAEAMR